MPLRQRLRRLRRLHPLSDLTRLAEDLLECLATAELDADAAVARQRAGAGKDEVAHTGKAGEGLEAPAEGDAEPGHLVQAARDQSGVSVRAEAEAFDNARGDGDDVLERAGELDAGDVVRAIEPEGAAAEHPLRRLREVVVGRGDDGDGRIAARRFEREGRSGEYGEAAQRLAEDLRRDPRHRLQRLVLDALRAGDNVDAATQV